MLYVVKDHYTGEAYEIVDIEGDGIQEYIYKVKDEFYEGADEYGFCDGKYENEYIVDKLVDKYNCKVLDWSNDNFLYI